MQTIRIARIIEHWDMREKHRLRRHIASRRLKVGECLLALNNALDMARLIDSQGGVHDYYCENGQEFDLPTITDMVRKGWRIELQVGRSEVRKAEDLAA